MSNLQPFTSPTFLPTSYGTITDGGRFRDGASHPASSNGFSTLAALQTQFKAASFTATGTTTATVGGSGSLTTTATVGGTLTSGDTLHLIATSSALSGSPITITYTTVGGDTTTTMATGLAAAVNANSTLTAAGVVATHSGAVVTLVWSSLLSPTSLWTESVGGAATETITIANAGDTLHLIATSSALSGSPITITYTTVGGDTTTTMATGLAAAVNANSTLTAAGVSATHSGAVVTLSWPSSLSPTILWTESVGGAATETIAVSYSLVASSVTGALYQGLTFGVVTGIPAGTRILYQISGTNNGAGVYTTSGPTTISAAAATCSWASATSNDMAGLMIQAAIHAGHVNGSGTVPLAGGMYFNLPNGLNFPANTNVKLVLDAGAILLCSPCGSNPAVTFVGVSQTDAPFTGGQLWGANTKEFGGGQSAGDPNTGIFTAGSSAMHFLYCNNVVVRNVAFQNFDEPFTWDTTYGGNYMVCVEDSDFLLCNKGYIIDAIGAPNSFERMSGNNLGLGSNNYNVWLNFSSSETMGSGGGIGADAYLINTSLDYPFVLQLWYNNGGDYDLLSMVSLDSCHIETSSSTTGTGARISHSGDFKMSNTYWFETGSNPSGLIEHAFLYAASTINGCHNGCFASTDATQVPFVTSAQSANVQGSGNTGRGTGGIALLFLNENGGLNSAIQMDPRWYTISADATLQFGIPAYVPLPVTATCTVTIPLNTTTPFAVGITFLFSVAPNDTLTLAAAGGVTLVGPAVFAGPAFVALTQYSLGVWYACCGVSPGFPVSSTYTASGAIALTDNLSIVNSASATTMTVGTPAAPAALKIKNLGAGTAAVVGNIDTTASHSISVTTGGTLNLTWDAALTTWIMG